MAKDELDGFEAKLRALFGEQVSGDDDAVPPAAAPQPGRAAERDKPEVTDDLFNPPLQSPAPKGNEGGPRQEAREPVTSPKAANTTKPNKAPLEGGSFTTLFQPPASKGDRARGGQASAPRRAAPGPSKVEKPKRAPSRAKKAFTDLLGFVAAWRKPSRTTKKTAAPGPTSHPAKPTKPERRRDFIWFYETLLRPLVLLGILGAAAHAFYGYFFPHEEPASLRPVQVEAAQPAAVAPIQTPDEVPAQPAVESEGEFAIQVAMCFLSACVSEFQEKLSQQNLAMRVEERAATQETIEVYSETAFATQDEAAALADSINREFRMRDQVYVFSDSNEFHISMGSFADLARAESFKDVLNQRFQDRATFAPRIRSSDYMMQVIMAGSFTSRRLAEAALATLIAADTVFAESYVVRR